MVEKVKELMIKYREIIVYLIVGVLTTIVSWAAAYVGKFFLDTDITWQNTVNNAISWAAGVLFAYPLNRKWVFQSKNKEIMKEFFGFASSRISTLILDMVVMQVLTAVGVNLLVATVISAVLVIIGNYVFSKLFVFNKKKDTEAEEAK